MDIVATLIEALALARGAIKLDPQTFTAALNLSNGLTLALVVVLLGGLSDMLGQSVVLFANRVKPGRFVLSLVAAGLVLAVSIGFWAASIWLISTLVFDIQRPFRDVLVIVYLSYAPLLFGFLVFLPYLGNIVFRVLRIWILLALLTGVQAAYALNFWQAALTCLLGWVAYDLLTRLPILPLEPFSRWLWRVVTGTPEPFDIQAMADRLADEGRLLVARQMTRITNRNK